MTQLPALGALRTFEAAARHLSFTKAAEELFVTQVAVSHQIKALEGQLGVPLFRRGNRALLLTDEGQTLLPFVREAFERIQAGLRRLEDGSNEGILTVSTTPSFASSWLAPRLVRFQARHPEIEISLSAASRLSDYDRERIDCGVRYGKGTWPGLEATRLLYTPLLPVCSPEFLAAHPSLSEPADLARHTLIHVLGDLDDWRLWLQAAGVEGIDPTRGPKFDSGPLALQAAMAGAGIAIARAPLIRTELASGRLVAPIDFEVPEASAYYLVVRQEVVAKAKIEAFRSWLLEEVAAQAESDGLQPAR
jgi:LysR family glycine cleavage system transcriptional activator